MKTHFILTTLILISISISAQNYKQVTLDYDITEEKNIGIETTYDFSDSVKLVIVTITNKSKKDIRVFRDVKLLTCNGCDRCSPSICIMVF